MTIRITIEGTQEGLLRLQSLFESGEFDELSGFRVLEVRELTEQEEHDRNNSRIFKFFHNRIKELGITDGTAKYPILVASQLLDLGLDIWDETALTSAKLLALGFGAARTYDEPRNDNFIINNGDWYIYCLGCGEYILIFVKNLRHNLSLGYPSLFDMNKYKESKADPNPINEQTSLMLRQAIAIINNIGGEEI